MQPIVKNSSTGRRVWFDEQTRASFPMILKAAAKADFGIHQDPRSVHASVNVTGHLSGDGLF